jgi:uncharacterized C2H2 Zn-finger protein
MKQHLKEYALISLPWHFEDRKRTRSNRAEHESEAHDEADSEMAASISALGTEPVSLDQGTGVDKELFDRIRESALEEEDSHDKTTRWMAGEATDNLAGDVHADFANANSFVRDIPAIVVYGHADPFISDSRSLYPRAPEADDSDMSGSRHTRYLRVAGGYACGEGSCSKAFDTYGEWQKHRRIHLPDKERPFPCPQCSRAFVDAKDLRRHLARGHKLNTATAEQIARPM